MGSSPPNALTPLQRDLIDGFFRREQRFVLTGGAALVGFYFGHRTTDDLDFFSTPGPELTEAAAAVEAGARECGAHVLRRRTHIDFQRLEIGRGQERCVVDLVIDRVPRVDPDKPRFGAAIVDSLREIASNKICTLISRSEIRDFIDLKILVEHGIDLVQAFSDAYRKDGAAEPETLAWILEQLTIAPTATLPGGIDPVELDRFRRELVIRLRKLAFERARR